MKKKILLILGIIIICYELFTNGPLLFLKILSLNSENAPITSSGTSSLDITPPYKNGTFMGNAADAFYGNIQVQAVISNGKITDVQFLQYPNDRSRSIAINTITMPNLKQEAIQIQSSNVDIISGATDSSNAFKESLASALSQAK